MSKQDDCPFKSAEALGLTQKQWEALIKTLMAMEAGEIQHISGGLYDGPRRIQKGATPLFNMSSWNNNFVCGTVCCIGGTAEFLGKLPMDSLDQRAFDLKNEKDNPSLSSLFYPPISYDYNAITPTQAAMALRGYLTTGTTDWDATGARKLP